MPSFGTSPPSRRSAQPASSPRTRPGTLTKNEMTVRVVVTASGRVAFEGSGYAPHGTVQRDERRTDRWRRCGSSSSARSRSPICANNATVQERDGRWTVQGDPTEGALLVAARKAGLERRCPRRAAAARRRSAVLVRAQVDEHHPSRRASSSSAASSSPRAPPTCSCPRCTFEVVGDDRRPLTAARRAEILPINEGLAGQALRTLGVAGRWLTDDAVAEHAGAS